MGQEVMEDLQLLREYAGRRTERAFTELVTRHMNFVYSTALRLVKESQRAEDVTQFVSIQLARKGGNFLEGQGNACIRAKALSPTSTCHQSQSSW